MFWHVVKSFAVHRSLGLGCWQCWRPTAARPGCNSGLGRCLCQLGPKGSNPHHQPLESWCIQSLDWFKGKHIQEHPKKKWENWWFPVESPVNPHFCRANKGVSVAIPRSSELSKLVANAMLAQRVSSINSISRRSAVGIRRKSQRVHLGYAENPTIICFFNHNEPMFWDTSVLT